MLFKGNTHTHTEERVIQVEIEEGRLTDAEPVHVHGYRRQLLKLA